MQTIKKKLRSQYGASITFALLLFLVCAALCSVIIVAATTAAGRMSKLAETDQRYYAVTSAAELMKDLLKEPVSIVQRDEIIWDEITTNIKTETTVTTTVEAEDSTEEEKKYKQVTETTTTFRNEGPVISYQPKKTKRYLVKKAANTITDDDYIPANQFFGEERAAETLIIESIANDAAYRIYNKTINNSGIDLLTRNFSLSSTDISIQALEMVEKLEPKDRLLTLEISNADNPKYTLELIFQANIQNPPTITQDSPKKTTIPNPTVTTESTDQNTTVVTTTTVRTDACTRMETNIVTVSWELTEIKTKTAS